MSTQKGSGDSTGLAEQITAQIRDWILDGKYSPGDKLPPERRLASLLGVNRGSLRLALKRLEQLGLLRARQGDGTRVQDLRHAAGIELLPHLFRTTLARQPEVLRDVLELRVLLCAHLVKQATRKARKNELRRVYDTVDIMKLKGNDPEALILLDFDIFWEYARVGGSIVGQLLLNTVRSPFEQNSELFMPMAMPPHEVIQAEIEIAQAVEAGDGQLANECATKYLESSSRKALLAAGLEPD